MLRLAVVGGGHLGRIHTKLSADLPNTELAAVVEPDQATAARLVSDFGCRVVSNVNSIIGSIDAAIVASPTRTHFEIATLLLSGGIHTLIEKPVTTTAPQADHLISLADRKNLTLQVGHVERFNPAFEKAVDVLPTARFIEASRMSGFTFRSTDVGVVHDLMIHDIDLVCSLVPSPLIETRAVGISVFGPHEDIAQARLEFSDGTVANLTASRCSFEPTRKISWFSEEGYVSADLAGGTVRSVGRSSMIDPSQVRDVANLDSRQQQLVRDGLFEDVLPMQMHNVEPLNAIRQEQLEFMRAVRSGTAPRVSGRDGRRAVSIAQSIVDAISQHRWTDGLSQRIGHQAGRINLLPIDSQRRAG